MKVLQVNKYYYPITGGIEKVVQDLSEGFREDPEIDNRVLVCQPKGRGIAEEVRGVRVIRCGSLGTFSSVPLSLPFLWRFRRLARTQDIVHIHTPFPLGDLACLLSGYEGKVVIWWHSDVIRQKRMMKLYRPVMERFLKRADAIVVATEGHINGSAYLKPYREKCHVIAFGVERELIEDAKSRPFGPRPADSTVHFLFAGRLVYYKGCEILLEAFAGLKRVKTDLTLVGDGPLRPKLEEMARRLGIRERVSFLGEVPRKELYDQFAGCDVFVLPSVARSEAFGIVQIEAMAYGKPVINTDLKSGVPYVSRDGETGLTARAGDVSSLTAAMQRLAESPKLRKRYGETAVQWAEQRYHMDHMLNQVKELYRRLLEG